MKHQIVATGEGPLAYSATDLPPGLSIDSISGVISGQITKEGGIYPISYVVEIMVTDSLGRSVKVKFSWIVSEKAVNNRPEAFALAVKVAQNSSGERVTLKGKDVNNDPLTYIVLTQPKRGSLTGTPPNLTYVPRPGEAGDDSFTYKTDDGRGLDSLVATASINIAFPPQAMCPADVVAKPNLISVADGRLIRVRLLGVSDIQVKWIHQDEPTGRSIDGYGVGASSVKLRAERLSASKRGNGRVYFIGFEARHATAGRCAGEVKVQVPVRKGRPAIAGSVRYDSTKKGSTPLPP